MFRSRNNAPDSGKRKSNTNPTATHEKRAKSSVRPAASVSAPPPSTTTQSRPLPPIDETDCPRTASAPPTFHSPMSPNQMPSLLLASPNPPLRFEHRPTPSTSATARLATAPASANNSARQPLRKRARPAREEEDYLIDQMKATTNLMRSMGEVSSDSQYAQFIGGELEKIPECDAKDSLKMEFYQNLLNLKQKKRRVGNSETTSSVITTPLERPPRPTITATVMPPQNREPHSFSSLLESSHEILDL